MSAAAANLSPPLRGTGSPLHHHLAGRDAGRSPRRPRPRSRSGPRAGPKKVRPRRQAPRARSGSRRRGAALSRGPRPRPARPGRRRPRSRRRRRRPCPSPVRWTRQRPEEHAALSVPPGHRAVRNCPEAAGRSWSAASGRPRRRAAERRGH